MYKKLLACGTVAMLAAGLGCKRHTDTPPTVLEGEGGNLMPVSVEEARHDSEVIGPVASKDELEPLFAPKPGEAGDGGLAIQNDTPQALAETYVQLLNRGQTAQLFELATSRQQEAIQDYLAAIQPIGDAMTELQRVILQKFPDFSLADVSPTQRQWMIINVQEISDTEATFAIETSDGQNMQQLTAVRTDGNWWVEYPQDQIDQLQNAPTDQVAQQSQQVANAIRDIVQRIRNDEITDEQALRTALEDMSRSFMPGSGG
jgi:hypothetical protein